MSTTQMTKELRVDGVLTDPDGNLMELTNLLRTDTATTVTLSYPVAMTKDEVGIYYTSWDDPDINLTYYATIVVTVNGIEYTFHETVAGTVGAEGLEDTELSTLLPTIIPYLPSCPEPLIQQQLQLIARDFCKHTEIWQEVVELDYTDLANTAVLAAEISAAATTATLTSDPGYLMPLEDFVIMIGTEQIYVTSRSGVTLTVTRGYDSTTAAIHTISSVIYYDFATYDMAVTAGSSLYKVVSVVDLATSSTLAYSLTRENTIVLAAPVVSLDETLAATVISIPAITNSDMPNWLVARYGDVLRTGVLGNLMRQQNKPWFSQEWEVYQKEYQSGKGEAISELMTDRSPDPIRLIVPSF